MPELVSAWPQKPRELSNHHMDSTLWDAFTFRDDDVIVATYGKAGTTWTQQIVGQLIFRGDPDVRINELSPWWDLRLVPPEARQMVAAQPHRRVIKTHLPADALRMSPQAKYLYVARDGRDVMWSMYNHHANFVPEAYEMLNHHPDYKGEELLTPPDPDIRRYFLNWLENDGKPFWSFWENSATWWALRDAPNVKLVHFNDLKADLAGTMRGIAEFLDVDLSRDEWDRAVEHCTFDWMKNHADRAAPMGGVFWEGGAETFINKGVNGRWKDVLTPADSLAYERACVENLGPECARWVNTGERT